MRPLLNFITNTDQDACDTITLQTLAEKKTRRTLSPDDLDQKKRILMDIAFRQRQRKDEMRWLLRN